MAMIPVDNVGAIGLIQDQAAHRLPPEGWSLVQNVRFRDGYAESFPGHIEVYATPTVAPYFTDQVVNSDLSRFWIYGGLAKVYAHNGVTHANITRQTASVDVDYAAVADDNWHGFPFHGLYLLNNSRDTPQVWNPPSLSQKLVNLPNWPSGYVARILRPYKTYLVAGDLTEGGVRYPHNLLWSNNTEPGTVPSSWVISDPTVDAGETPLSDSRERLVEMMALGQYMMLYKGDAVYRMSFVGGRYIFQIDNWTANLPILSRKCVQDLGGQHVVFTKNDLVMHDGNTIRSLLTKRLRNMLTSTLDYVNYQRAYLTRYSRSNEIWACFPVNGGSGFADKAIVWNYEDNTLGLRDLQGFAHIVEGLYSPTLSLTIDDDTSVIDLATTDGVIDSANFTASGDSLIASDPTNTKFFLLDSGNKFNTSTVQVVLERTGLTLNRQDRFGNLQVDVTSHKIITEVWPRIEGTAGATINIYVGAQDSTNAAVAWKGPYPFVLGTNEKIDCYVTGVLPAIRFTSQADVSWKLYGYTLNVAFGGRP